ncbi:glycyl-radical enzyme activating protein [Carboxylicivirga sp. RSCT41]|uniref:glycyl-radical enzyme activating protein n=1 Tax=Carboxylicivirga agarovorans TaxID=3417570 RepID=UPI003D341D25
MEGRITTIQRMSIHDGPGIRSTVFLKGCNMRCRWCHNPETFSPGKELEWLSDKCINCRECLPHCATGALRLNAGTVQFDKSKCTACFKCIDACFADALNSIGRDYSPQALFKEVMQDKVFFEQSGGGVTFSGGEVMLQIDFVTECMKLFKEAKIHTAIETNLLACWDNYRQLLPYVDLVMADLKVMDNVSHKKWTSVGNEVVISNIQELDKTGKAYCIRTPLVPGVNHSHDAIEAIAGFVSGLKHVQKFELLPFHPLADSKYNNLGLANPFEHVKALGERDLKRYQNILMKYNLV